MARVTEVRVTPTPEGFRMQAYRKVARGKVRMGAPLEVTRGDKAVTDLDIEAWYHTVNPPKPETATTEN